MFEKQANKQRKGRLFRIWSFQAAEKNLSFHSQQAFIFKHTHTHTHTGLLYTSDAADD